MKLIRSLLPLLVSFYFISCGTQQKMPTYLQNYSDSSGKQAVNVPDLLIQKNDMLSIQVYSASTKPEISDALYNLPVAAPSSSTGSSGGSVSTSPGYLVDNSGNIEYPRVGILHVEGLTKNELADLIKKRINEKDSVLTNPSVIVRFQNLKITVLGEVKKPGMISFPGERMTILEALGLAGDVDIYGMKDKVKVIREVNGQRETGTIDLSDKKLFDSPYYNLVQNDVVLVEPAKSKAKKADQDVTLRQAGFVISVITAIAVVVRLFQ
ncbi:MAG TPA: polysaccharide biosynthesis/export family protein [Chitinophagaceae bacterium]|nr:polysaccharide biosynthesis/export family protein [Chitinophagaceae bacterium]